jgi:uncharacterized protein
MSIFKQKWLKNRMNTAHNASNAVLNATQMWLERIVIGLNLCPFAKAVHIKQQIRWVVSQATSAEQLAQDVQHELALLRDADPAHIDTTLLIHPLVLQDFIEYNDFLNQADALLDQMQLDGVVQIASFHPHYQFAGTVADDVTNHTNRSPYPMLHLLREDSVARAVAATPDAAQIYERNMATLRRLGLPGLQALLAVNSTY